MRDTNSEDSDEDDNTVRSFVPSFHGSFNTAGRARHCTSLPLSVSRSVAYQSHRDAPVRDGVGGGGGGVAETGSNLFSPLALDKREEKETTK